MIFYLVLIILDSLDKIIGREGVLRGTNHTGPRKNNAYNTITQLESARWKLFWGI